MTTLAAVGLAAPGPASGDTAPTGNLPATVSVDSLPTVQVNGVVWSQVTVGNTVWATGQFTKARPAGSAPGQNEVSRSNLLAYDITTGDLINSINLPLNAAGMVVTASPDGSRVYVGGDFTSIAGHGHTRIAAIDTATNTVIDAFNPRVNDRVGAITATNAMVYFGGKFTNVNGYSRGRLALFSAAGVFQTWAPTVDDYQVKAMVLTPDRGKVVVGGQFTSANRKAAPGLVAFSATSGGTVGWAASAKVRNFGQNAGIASLQTDGTYVYGTGWGWHAGTLEGIFAADPSNGAIVWVADCHGDSYSTSVANGVVYLASHTHDCMNMGGMPETTPLNFQRATAYTTYATGTLLHNVLPYHSDWGGTPMPTQLHWYPTLMTGTFTGQIQAAWSVTGNAQYVSYGGEFPSVNGTNQQGLARFAVSSLAPNTAGPRPWPGLTPRLSTAVPGTVRVAFSGTFDQDNTRLTYQLVRDGHTSTPVWTQTVDSSKWNIPQFVYTDTDVAAGEQHTYRLYVTDPFGNSQVGGSVSTTVPQNGMVRYPRDVLTDGAQNFWRLDDSAPVKSTDIAGTYDLTVLKPVIRQVPGAQLTNPNPAMNFQGTSAYDAGMTTGEPIPDNWALEGWFNTTSTKGGAVFSLADTPTDKGLVVDCVVWLDATGKLHFGAGPPSLHVLNSAARYNDGKWHYVVAQMTPQGMQLWVDAVRIGIDASITHTSTRFGNWRLGGVNMSGWPSRGTSDFIGASIDDVAFYPMPLTGAQITTHWVDSGRPAP